MAHLQEELHVEMLRRTVVAAIIIPWERLDGMFHECFGQFKNNQLNHKQAIHG